MASLPTTAPTSLESIPLFREAPERLIRDFDRQAVRKQFENGQLLAMEGDGCSYFHIVLKGAIRVYKSGETGREITLYRVRPFESCVLTVFCILSYSQIPAFAVAEEDVEVALVSAPTFRDWVHQYDHWRQFTFQMMSVRLAEILHTIDRMAFQRLDVRVAAFLLNSRTTGDQIVQITHEKLASEVG